MIVMPFKKALDAYDPYGVYRVNAFQSVMMISALFMMNAVLHFPQFNTTVFLPVFGGLTICVTNGYGKRLEGMLIYSVITIIYTVALSLVHNSRVLTVVLVGVVISSLFILAKKYKPQLLGMIPMIHITAYTALAIPCSGGAQLSRWIINLALMAFLSIGLLSLFPRIYFFRVWLRVFYLTIIEMEEKLHIYKQSDVIASQLLFKNFKQISLYTATLSNQEHGFCARRISVALTNIYMALIALIHEVEVLGESELNVLSHVLHRLSRAILNNDPVHDLNWGTSENLCFLQFRKELCSIVNVWNQLCLKL